MSDVNNRTPAGVCPEDGVNHQELWETGEAASGERGRPWFPLEDRIALLNNSTAGRSSNPLLRDKQELHLVHLVSKVVWLGDFICRNLGGRRAWEFSHSKPS